MLGWMKHKQESRLLGEISLNSDMQMTSPLWQKGRGTKELLDEVKEESEKSQLKTQHSKNEDHGNNKGSQSLYHIDKGP